MCCIWHMYKSLTEVKIRLNHKLSSPSPIYTAVTAT